MKLTNRKSEIFVEPQEGDIIAAFKDIVANPESDDGYTFIILENFDGWRLTSYGAELIVLDHEDGQNNLTSHLAELDENEACNVLIAFSKGNNIKDKIWAVGYGPT